VAPEKQKQGATAVGSGDWLGRSGVPAKNTAEQAQYQKLETQARGGN
jgi:hypothetical protein